MKYSKLKHDLEILELTQKHELALLNASHKAQKTSLLSSCTHTYDDGSSTRKFEGTQWDSYYRCAICGKLL